VTPVKQKSKNQAMLINLPPDNSSDTATHPSGSTSTQDSLSYPQFPEHQNKDIMMDDDGYSDNNDRDTRHPV
jgi:hypothetical protein